MVDDRELSIIMETHLEAIDVQLEKMIEASFDHGSIHELRESIRRFRALMFFFIHNIRLSDYRMIEFISKKFFNMTSLIREIDVFETGYSAFMSKQTLSKLSEIKAPLIEALKEELEETNGFRFQQVKIHIRPFKNQSKLDKYMLQRRMELFELFLEKDDVRFKEEKYIHAKRMLVKKMLYVHSILMDDQPLLEVMNEALELFQQKAKLLHDVCVNLRFVGHYKLDDETLITKLILDHKTFSDDAEKQYELACKSIRSFINMQNK